MKEQEFDKIIKQKLEGLNESPPAYMWDRVASGIPAASTVSKGFWTASKLLFVAASILIVSGLSYFVFHKKTNNQVETIESDSHILQKEDVKQVSVESLEIAKTHNADESSNKIELTQLDPQAKSTIINTDNQQSTQNTSKRKQEIFTKAEESVIDSLYNSNTVNAVQNEVLGQKTNQKPKAEKIGVRLVLNDDPVDFETQQTATEKSGAVVVAPVSEQTVKSKVEIEQAENAVEKPTIAEQEVEKIGVVEKSEEIPNAVKTSALDNDKQEIDNAAIENDTESLALNNPKSRQIKAYGIGFHYGPEFMDVGGTKLTDQAFDLSFNYQSYNFIFQTGLGLKISNDKVDYNMKYKQWDYLETQMRFDSAIIVLDQNGKPVLTPVDPYYVEVYDSLTHNYSSTATEQNFILTIPLLVGYQVDYKSFAYFIKGGIRYSVVVHKNTTDLLKLNEKAHLVNMNYPNQNRAKSNIDYELSIGGAYKLSSQFQIQVELFGRYYHYSIYEENLSSGIHPWSLSGRIGLIYRLK